jgi:hypothetical protein
MMTSMTTGESLLALDIGTITTRAILFDVVEGRYRFIASGIAVSTAGSPFNDVGEGVRRALDKLETVTGRELIGADENLIIPSQPDGSGIDNFVVTMSAGKPLRILIAGLLEDVSVESAKRLAQTTYSDIADIISLNDRRQQDNRIDTILSTHPDLIIMTGGLEGGASLSVRRLLDVVTLGCSTLPENLRPHILYAGNYSMQVKVQEALTPLTNIEIAPNIRPTLENEQLGPAQARLSNLFRTIHSQTSSSISELNRWAEGQFMPTSMAIGRIISFLSKVYRSEKGALGIDLGASATTLATAFDGKLSLGVFPELGLGSGVSQLLRFTKLDHIARWLPVEIPPTVVRDYVFNKSAFPASLPVTKEEMAIEQAITRQVMQVAVRRLKDRFPKHAPSSGADALPHFEPILASGSVLSHAPTPGQALMMLLDGLQPSGVTTILLDQNDLVAALGAAAEANPVLAVQVLGSNTMLNLGTVISPVGKSRLGVPVLRVRITYEDGRENSIEVKYGSLDVLPLNLGETATLRLQPLHRFDAGMGPGRGGRLQVVGGVLGVIIDTRGRPVSLHDDPDRRRDILKKWLWTLGN